MYGFELLFCMLIATGLLEAPTDVSIKVGVEYMTLSWNPPFTLDGVPILQYTVYIISQRHRETVNTTKTHITLEGSCTSPVYQISAWNEVGEGNTVTYGITVSKLYTSKYI